ncbi:hypothetical protein Tco_0533744 [Tanacetum coccineum]
MPILSLRPLIMEYLVNISKRRAFWSLNEDILKITVLTTNTPYPSRKIRRICACTHQRRRPHDQYAVSSEDQYAVLEIINVSRSLDEVPPKSKNDMPPRDKIMAGRSTRSNTANNTNPHNETADEVARQLNTALPNLLTQLVQALRGNRVNQREVAKSCSIKTFRASGAKEFFDTEGAVGLLTWFESIDSVLHITKCPAESQVEFASSMLQGRTLTWCNTLVQTQGRATAIAQP